MNKIQALWNLFALTGNIDAYLLYRDCVNELEKRGTNEEVGSETPGPQYASHGP